MLIVWSGWWWLRKTWRDGLGRDAEVRQRIEDQRAPGDHPGIGDDRARRRRGRARRCCRRDRRRSRRGAGGRRSPTACYPVAARGRASRRTGCAATARGPGCHPRRMTHGPPGRSRPARRPHRDHGRRPHVRGGASRSATGGSSRSARTTTVGAAGSDRTRRVVELRGRTVTPGFGDAHVHPVSCRRRPAALRPRGRCAGSTPTSPRSPATRRTTRTSRGSVGDGWSMADFPGGIPRPRRPRPGRAGPAGLPREPRRPHGLGQLGGARAGRARRRQPRPGRRPHRARRRRPPERRPPGGARSTSSSGCSPRRRADDLVAGLRLAQAELHAPRHHPLAGRDRPTRVGRGRLHDARRPGRADRPASSGRCGGTGAAASSRSTSSSSGARGRRSAATRRRASS